MLGDTNGKKDFLFSIITVVFNDKNNLEKTIKSVWTQKKTLKSNDIEYIVIDGASTDGSLYVIEKYKSIIENCLSEPDKGLYDAMNKGINKANGKYIIFMNAGDSFVEVNTLKKIKKNIYENNFPDFLYADAVEESKDGKFFLKKARSHKWLWYGMFTHHQAMIYKRSIIKKYSILYDLSFTIGADYLFTIMFLKYSKNIVRLNLAICNFKRGGISEKKSIIGLREQFLIRKNILKWPFLGLLLFLVHFVLLVFKKYFSRFYNRLRFNEKEQRHN